MPSDQLAKWRKFSAEEYHADPAPEPSLSSSVANRLLNRSPLHAWISHPRLNPAWEPEENSKMDFGTLAHIILLGKGREIITVEADDWRSATAQATRKWAREKGKLCCLVREYQQADEMVMAARDQLQMIDDCHDAFVQGKGVAEQVIMWEELDAGGQNPVWCRSMLDWMENRRKSGHVVIYDYKTTAMELNPRTVGAHLYNMEYEIPAAMYERGLERVLGPDVGGLVVFRFVFQEKDPPYLLQVVELDAAGKTIGRKKVSTALNLWRRCMMEGRWPAWPTRIIEAEMPSYQEDRWLKREIAEADMETAGDDPYMIGSTYRPKQPPKEIIRLGEAG